MLLRILHVHHHVVRVLVPGQHPQHEDIARTQAVTVSSAASTRMSSTPSTLSSSIRMPSVRSFTEMRLRVTPSMSAVFTLSRDIRGGTTAKRSPTVASYLLSIPSIDFASNFRSTVKSAPN